MRLRVNQLSHTPRWLWVSSTGLGCAVFAVVCVLLILHYRALPFSTALETEEPNMLAPTHLATELTVTESITLVQLPELDFQPGSVEELCGLNELPTYWITGRGLQSNSTQMLDTIFKTDECRIALEVHMSASNPYQFLAAAPHTASLAEFVKLNEPFTFERIFADPEGDLLRVQDALARPECSLKGDETDWNLKDACHAESLMNYAYVNLLCFRGGIRYRNPPVYWPEGNPTPEQDRFMWKRDLEDHWVENKCNNLNPSLKLSTEHQSELHALVTSLNDPNSRKRSLELLVELAARLGDDAAALAQHVSGTVVDWAFSVAGYKYGRYSNLVNRPEWSYFNPKIEPGTDRFLNIFHLLAHLDSPRPDPREEIEFDWEFVVRHLCEPPYYDPTYIPLTLTKKVEHSSCKEIVHEIRQKRITFPPLLKTLDKFEQVALELEVYE